MLENSLPLVTPFQSQFVKTKKNYLASLGSTRPLTQISKSICPHKAFCLKPQLSHHLGRLWKYYSSIPIPIVMLMNSVILFISSNFAIRFKFNRTISHSCFSTWVLKGWQSCRHPYSSWLCMSTHTCMGGPSTSIGDIPHEVLSVSPALPINMEIWTIKGQII
jgi:hypothetical protein